MGGVIRGSSSLCCPCPRPGPGPPSFLPFPHPVLPSTPSSCCPPSTPKRLPTTWRGICHRWFPGLQRLTRRPTTCLHWPPHQHLHLSGHGDMPYSMFATAISWIVCRKPALTWYRIRPYVSEWTIGWVEDWSPSPRQERGQVLIQRRIQRRILDPKNQKMQSNISMKVDRF